MNIGTEITAWAELRSMIDLLLGEPEALLNTEQAAAYLNIAPESLRRLVRRKAISFVEVLPSEYRFPTERSGGVRAEQVEPTTVRRAVIPR